MDAQVILVALVVSVFAPLVLAMVTGNQQRKSKKQDWDRQDELTARAEASAEKIAAATALLSKKAEVIAVKVEEVAVAAVEAHSETSDQLGQIHALVNSDMTAARQELLDQTRVTLAMLKKIAAADAAAGHPISPEDTQVIADTEKRIITLQAILVDRQTQQSKADDVANNSAKEL